MIRWTVHAILAVSLALGFSPALAQDPPNTLLLPDPDWVHPSLRGKYPGYEKRLREKESGAVWTFSTNRPGGNIRGGGSTPYREYRPLFPAGPRPAVGRTHGPR
jgi:hypothetical protein